jgi:MFS family permease
MKGAARRVASMDARSSGVGIAMAAILVQAPRLVLAVLAADHQAIGAAWERGLLVVAGIGTATVLTGGNLYLAHAIGSRHRRRRWLVGVWLLVLASTGGLVVPLIAAGLGGRTLPELLGGAALTWTWSGLAALAHEVTAAGCVLAAAALGSDAAAAERQGRLHAEQQEQLLASNAELLAQRDAARAELAALRQRHGERLSSEQLGSEPLGGEQLSGRQQPSSQQVEEQA